jgi:hypothetical protein
MLYKERSLPQDNTHGHGLLILRHAIELEHAGDRVCKSAIVTVDSCIRIRIDIDQGYSYYPKPTVSRG